MPTKNLYDLLIIGGGPGGLSAGIYARRASMKTALIEKFTPGGQVLLSTEVENYPGFKHISGAELSEKLIEHAKDYGLELLTAEVEEIIPGLEFHSVRFSNGKIMKTHAIIMATGGSPRKLGITGEEDLYGKGISYCAVCDGFFFKNKEVLVVGGGDTAAEEALYLSKLAKKVTIIHRRDKLRASMIFQQRIGMEKNIAILWNHIVTEITEDQGRIRATLQSTAAAGHIPPIEADGMFIFIGFNPNNQLVPAGIKLSRNGYVITDDRCETNIRGIFAVGDLREKYARQIVLAVADGCTAALAAAHYVETKKVK